MALGSSRQLHPRSVDLIALNLFPFHPGSLGSLEMFLNSSRPLRDSVLSRGKEGLVVRLHTVPGTETLWSASQG